DRRCVRLRHPRNPWDSPTEGLASPRVSPSREARRRPARRSLDSLPPGTTVRAGGWSHPGSGSARSRPRGRYPKRPQDSSSEDRLLSSGGRRPARVVVLRTGRVRAATVDGGCAITTAQPTPSDRSGSGRWTVTANRLVGTTASTTLPQDGKRFYNA